MADIATYAEILLCVLGGSIIGGLSFGLFFGIAAKIIDWFN